MEIKNLVPAIMAWLRNPGLPRNGRKKTPLFKEVRKGPGHGGSCFPKDVKALIATAEDYGMELKIVNATELVNDEQKVYVFHKIEIFFKGDLKVDLKNRIFTFWGVAFKANTDDVREASAIAMARALIKEGAIVHFFDPVASENFMKAMKDYPKCEGKIKSFDNKYDCLNGSDGLVTMTEWREFRVPNFDEVKSRLKTKVIFDGRNLYETKKNERFRFYLFCDREIYPESLSARSGNHC